MDTIDIPSVLPHRYPFLFIDRVLEVEPGKRAVGLKNVSSGEPYFVGHFPGKPIMPGVLILEAMAQMTVFAAFGERSQGKLGLLAGVDRARFRRPVVPGDQLRLEVELTQLRGLMGKAQAKATVDGQLVAEAEILFALKDIKGV